MATALATEGLAQTQEDPSSGVRSVSEGPPSSHPLEGDRYLTRQTLGEGGFGRVVLAIDRTIGREVAVKTLLRDERSSRRAFLDEARLVANLDHPNVVPVHDVGVDGEGRPYFVMKLIRGEPLDELISRLRRGDREAHERYCYETRIAVFERLLDALAHAHHNGVVHRDIKPSNVMIGAHGEVYLVDWGIAARIGADAAAVGTPMYMAPEQIRGEPADPRADIHSACVLLHEFLCLRHYLDDCSTVEQTFLGVQGRAAPLASDVKHEHQTPVPMDLSWFVAKGLEKDPSLRYQSVEEMCARLRDRREGRIPVQCGQTLVKRGMFEVMHFFERHPLLPTILLVSLFVTIFAVVVFARA